MSVIKTISAEKPEGIFKIDYGAMSDVWLRKNIERDVADNGPDGEPCEFWRADEVHFTVPFMTAEEVSENFDALWAEHGDKPTTDERLSALESAAMELADIIGGEVDG